MLLFDWDDANRDHIAIHHVTPAEAEEALSGMIVDLGIFEFDGEERNEQLGSTATGRILFVVTTFRQNLIRVVTSYEAPKALKRDYMLQYKTIMAERKQLPAFQSEAEEAAWWFETREERAEEFLAAIRDGRARVTTMEQRLRERASILLDPEDLTLAQKIAKARGVEYKTYVKSLLHEALLHATP